MSLVLATRYPSIVELVFAMRFVSAVELVFVVVRWFAASKE